MRSVVVSELANMPRKRVRTISMDSMPSSLSVLEWKKSRRQDSSVDDCDGNS